MTDSRHSVAHVQALNQAFDARLARGYAHLARRELDAAMTDFEAAHILGQSHTLRHLRSHLALLSWGWKAQDNREIAGQLGRLVGAALFTWIWVPRGNPGSTRVRAFAPQPIPEDLAPLLGKNAS